MSIYGTTIITPNGYCKKGLNGKYKVTYTYVPGRVPGCEPIHSGPCNAGYYKASYSRIGDV